MEWSKLYSEYRTTPNAELRERISALNDIGPGFEVVELIIGTEDADIRMRLLRKALELEALFTESDFVELDGELPSFDLARLIKFGNVDFSDSESVTEALESIFDEGVKRALYERAYLEDVKFSDEQLDRIGYENIDSAHQNSEGSPKNKKQGGGCLLSLFAIAVGILAGLRKKKKYRA